MNDIQSFQRIRNPKFKLVHLLTFEGVVILRGPQGPRDSFESDPFSCAEEVAYAREPPLPGGEPWPKESEFRVGIRIDGNVGDDYDDMRSLVSVNTVSGVVFAKNVVFQVLDIKSNPIETYSLKYVFITNPSGVGSGQCQWDVRLKKTFFPEDTLNLRIEIDYLVAPRNGGVVYRPARDPILHVDPTLRSDLLKFRNNTEVADAVIVTIVVAGKKFRAQRALLMARSEYFRALFESGLKESRTNEVTIGDADQAVFETYLDFIYTGAPPDSLSTRAWDLLPLADRFVSLGLKKMCEDAIARNLSVDNARDALALARAHGCPNLVKESSFFPRRHSRPPPLPPLTPVPEHPSLDSCRSCCAAFPGETASVATCRIEKESRICLCDACAVRTFA